MDQFNDLLLKYGDLGKSGYSPNLAVISVIISLIFAK